MKKNKIKRTIAGVLAAILVSSSLVCMPTITSSAIYDGYYYFTDETAQSFIDTKITNDLSTASKASIIVHYVAQLSHSDGETNNCIACASDVQKLCEAVGIPCYMRYSARYDAYAGNQHCNNVIDVDGTAYIADANYDDTKPIFRKATEVYNYYQGDGRCDGKFVYTVDDNGDATIYECFMFNADTITFPSEIAGHPVKSIWEMTFVDAAAIKKIVIPSSVTTLTAGYNFRNLDNLESVTLSENITELPYFCFNNCSKLSLINLENIKTYENSCLDNTAITSIDFTNATSIGEGVVDKCNSLKSVILPKDISAIPGCFAICPNLTSISIPSTATSIGQYAFSSCSSLELTVPDSVTSFGTDCFRGIKSVICSSNSAAHAYCKANNVTYKLTDAAPTDISTCTVSYETYTQEYTGTEKKPIVSRVCNGTKYLTEGVDYTIEYKNNINAGTGSIVIKGTGKYNSGDTYYTGTKNLDFTINAKNIGECDIKLDTYSMMYNGKGLEPGVTVTDETKTLTEGVDYTVKYAENVNIGTHAWVAIIGMGNYAGSSNGEYFTITACAHSWDNGVVTKEATCSSAGTIRYTCNNCGVTKTSSIPKIDHSANKDYWVERTVVEPTATTDGYTAYFCRLCGEWIEFGRTLPKTGSITNPVVKNTVISDADVSISNTSYVYTGSAIKPTITIKKNDTTLVAGTDYTISYDTNADVGEKYITITGAGEYTGTVVKTFTITAKSMTSATVSEISAQTYTGSAIKPTITVKDGTKALVNGTDYTVAYSNNTKAGTATVKIKGKGNYTGTITKTFTIKAKSMTSATVSAISAQTYKGSAIKPTITVKDGTKTLANGTDYTVAYSNNTKVGTATVKITGSGNYTGTITKTFTIKAKSMTSATVSTISAQTYKGSAIKPTITVKDGTKTLANGTDYTVAYSNNTKVGTATITIKGKGNYSGSITKTFTIKAKSISKSATVSGVVSKTYNGKAQTQKITVKLGSKVLVYGTDYTISYSSNKAVGEAKMVIKGKENYCGSFVKYFNIKPRKEAMKRVTADKKSFKAIWTKMTEATGYQLEYSTSSKFTNSKKTWITSKNSTAKTISKLSAKKTYYVRVRTYTKVGKTKYYGAWSTTVSVKTK